jgi:biopolymer transport protein ExbD
MAGVSVGESDENPVAINVTALVDIIFCLCVFFMISFKFKQIEGKFDTWLPKGKGTSGVDSAAENVISEIRIAMYWDENAEETIRQLGSRRIHSDEELERLIKDAYAAWVEKNRPDVPVTIDAEARVPWGDVVTVVNLAKRNEIEKVEFALGLPPSAEQK